MSRIERNASIGRSWDRFGVSRSPGKIVQLPVIKGGLIDRQRSYTQGRAPMMYTCGDVSRTSRVDFAWRRERGALNLASDFPRSSSVFTGSGGKRRVSSGRFQLRGRVGLSDVAATLIMWNMSSCWIFSAALGCRCCYSLSIDPLALGRCRYQPPVRP